MNYEDVLVISHWFDSVKKYSLETTANDSELS